MPLAPKLEDFPKIRGALKFYQVFAYVTGIMLLLLCVEMIVKYGLGYQLFAFSNYGALTLVPVKTAVAPTGVDLSTGILIAHGWLYVVYLFSDFRLWSLMRWPFSKFITIALGGVIPFLSFFVESRISKQVKSYLAGREAEAATYVEAAN
jgi:integral membrane protein